MMDLKLEVVVLPVSDVDKAKHFYETGLGCREDADLAGPGLRIVQMTPPGSACSIHFGEGVTSATPGSVEGLVIAVDDIEKACAELAERGVPVSDVFHDTSVGYNRFDPDVRASGPDPQRHTYASFATFNDHNGLLETCSGDQCVHFLYRLPRRRYDHIVNRIARIKLADSVDENRSVIQNKKLLGPVGFHTSSEPCSRDDGANFHGENFSRKFHQ